MYLYSHMVLVGWLMSGRVCVCFIGYFIMVLCLQGHLYIYIYICVYVFFVYICMYVCMYVCIVLYCIVLYCIVLYCIVM